MDIVDRLAGTPLSSVAYEIAHSGLDAAELVPRPDLPPFQRLGESRFGGLPELHRGVRWPRGGGRPLAMLLQLDLADLQGIAGTYLLPSAGTLWFFYDVVGQPSGRTLKERSRWRVLFAPAGAACPPSRHPTGIVDEHLLRPVVAVLQPTVTYPCPSSDDAPHCASFEEDLYRALVIGDDRISHRVLGHPDPIQRDPVRPGWVSLLQLDSDALLGTMWGDTGKLHWTIPADALARRQFGATRVELQCC